MSLDTKPTYHPTAIEMDEAMQRAINKFTIDFENFKSSKFPEKTGYLKRNTKIQAIGNDIIIEAPEYLKEQKIYPSLVELIESFPNYIKAELNRWDIKSGHF